MYDKYMSLTLKKMSLINLSNNSILPYFLLPNFHRLQTALSHKFLFMILFILSCHPLKVGVSKSLQHIASKHSFIQFLTLNSSWLSHAFSTWASIVFGPQSPFFACANQFIFVWVQKDSFILLPLWPYFLNVWNWTLLNFVKYNIFYSMHTKMLTHFDIMIVWIFPSTTKCVKRLIWHSYLSCLREEIIMILFIITLIILPFLITTFWHPSTWKIF